MLETNYSKLSFRVSNTVIVSDEDNLPKNLPFFITAKDGILLIPQYPRVYLFSSMSHLYHTMSFGVDEKSQGKSSRLQAPHHDAVKYTTTRAAAGLPLSSSGFRRLSNCVWVWRGIIWSVISSSHLSFPEGIHYVATYCYKSYAKQKY